jgi:hypothetical protein
MRRLAVPAGSPNKFIGLVEYIRLGLELFAGDGANSLPQGAEPLFEGSAELVLCFVFILLSGGKGVFRWWRRALSDITGSCCSSSETQVTSYTLAPTLLK